MAVYHFVIIDGKALGWVNPDQAVWISKETSRKEYRYTACVVNSRFKMTYVLTAAQVPWKAWRSWTPRIVGRSLLPGNERPKWVANRTWTRHGESVSQTFNKDIKKLGLYPFPRAMLNAPSVGQNDDNGNRLLSFSPYRDPERSEDGQQVKKALW